MNEFYMVFLEGEKTPALKHLTYEGAQNEAKRLSLTHEKTAYVLGTICKFQVPEKVVKTMCSVNELPF